MKTYFCIGLIAVTALLSCGKSGSQPSGGGDWQLLYKYTSIGSAATRVSSPAPDSMVYLQLNADSSYFTKLNNKIVSQNNYSIITSTNGGYTTRVIELKGFKPTGIFSLFPVEEIGSNNQVIAVYDGMFFNTNANKDTLTLGGALTPGGSISYLFIKAR